MGRVRPTYFGCVPACLLLLGEEPREGVVQRGLNGLRLHLRTTVAVFLHKAESVQEISPATHLPTHAEIRTIQSLMAVYLAGNRLKEKLFARIDVHPPVQHHVNTRGNAGYIVITVFQNKHITVAIYQLRFFKIVLFMLFSLFSFNIWKLQLILTRKVKHKL